MFKKKKFLSCDWSAILKEMSGFLHSSVSQALFPCFYGDRSQGTCRRNRMGSVQCGPWKPSTLSVMCPSKTAFLSWMDSRLTPLTTVRVYTDVESPAPAGNDHTPCPLQSGALPEIFSYGRIGCLVQAEIKKGLFAKQFWIVLPERTKQNDCLQ